jgi:hypothetical protein
VYGSSLKGIVSRDGYAFERLKNLIITSCMCADGFENLWRAYCCNIQLSTFYFYKITCYSYSKNPFNYPLKALKRQFLPWKGL